MNQQFDMNDMPKRQEQITSFASQEWLNYDRAIWEWANKRYEKDTDDTARMRRIIRHIRIGQLNLLSDEDKEYHEHIIALSKQEDKLGNDPGFKLAIPITCRGTKVFDGIIPSLKLTFFKLSTYDMHSRSSK